MPRRRKAVRRELLPDPKYGSVLVTRFISNLMRKGKKSLAERIFYNALDMVEGRAGQDGLAVFQKAVENVKPVVEVRPRRVGGQTYQIPMEVRPDRRTALSIRWIITNARSRQGKTMSEKLAGEFMDAAKGEGGAIRRREEAHRMAEANRAFAHYRW